jgi:hypothetical protein
MPPTRAEALATLEAGRSAIEDLLAQLSDDDLTRPATIGGGDWSAKDLIGHLAFWEELAVEALAAWRGGRRSAADGLVGDAGVDAANARDQAGTAAEPLERVRARAAAAQAAVRAAIESASDEEWRAPLTRPDGRTATLAERLGGILGAPGQPFGHAFAHLDDLRAYARTLGRGYQPARSGQAGGSRDGPSSKPCATAWVSPATEKGLIR